MSRAVDPQSGPRNKAFLKQKARLLTSCRGPHFPAKLSHERTNAQAARLLSCLRPGPLPRGEYGSPSQSHLLLFC